MKAAVRSRFRSLLALGSAVALTAGVLAGASPASAAAEPVLTVTASSSASSAKAGTDVIFTVTVTNAGRSTISMSGAGEYDGAGASVGLWLADPANCTRATSGGAAGGSENVCFATFATPDGCNTGSMGFPSGWTWRGLFTSTRPASLAPGDSFSCSVGVRVLKGVVAGAGLALEAWASPNGFEHYPGEHHADARFTAVTVPAAGAQDGPKVSGTAGVGKTLTASKGDTGPWNESATYRWLRNGKPISGATGKKYTTTASDLGARLSVRVVGHNTKGLSATSVTFTSPPTKKVAAGTFTAAPKPKITGLAKVGKTLKVKAGTWKPKASLSYQWYRGAKKISGATKTTYTLVRADRGANITVKVTGKKRGYVTTVTASVKTKKVAR